jgi:hypothetical protein
MLGGDASLVGSSRAGLFCFNLIGQQTRFATSEIRCNKLTPVGIRDSAVGIATGYGLDDRRVRVPVWSRIFFSTCSGAHRASYPVGTRGEAAGM